ncbi:MAG: prolyl oligopeptidase family serine peptidase [Bacteroidota bacterium]|nr:prolyl oligopeptidase family serine peptidase [Bacteroidota bacterium]
MIRRVLLLILCTIFSLPAAAQKPELSVSTIMQDPATYIGDWPSSPYWSEDGHTLYFRWNPKGEFPSDSLFKITRDDLRARQVPADERRNLPPAFNGFAHSGHEYDAGFNRRVYSRNGDLYVFDRRTGENTRLSRTRDSEQNPRFSPDGTSIIFRRDNNLYKLSLRGGVLAQLTDIRSGREPSESQPDEQDAFLQRQQLELFEVIREEEQEDDLREAVREQQERAAGPPPTFYANNRSLQQLQIDPHERFVTFITADRPEQSKRTLAVDWVTDSGYAEQLSARAKVGVPGTDSKLWIQDLARDSTYQVDLHQIEGAYDVPAYRQAEAVDSSDSKRSLYSYGPFWSADGQYAVLEIRARDNKDRWIVRLDPESADLDLLERQHDEAWIAGPGISWFGGASIGGWLPDSRRFYYQSEATGYSHLYTVEVETGAVAQLTSGSFEVFNPQISRNGRWWYFTSSEISPGVRHFYRMPLEGGQRTQLTTLSGRNTTALNPDEDLLGILRSVSAHPPEVYLQVPGEDATRITRSPTEVWLAYPWRTPKTIGFEASDGVRVPAHLFEPDSSNGAAVLFVHGAGYMQNVHDGWSGYYREYMFHNLLADLGYTVLQADYRASAGYGRDWRTAIYRHMGGRDLQDYVDASRYITRTHGIGPDQIGIYGGSYGGFITLMALFTAPEYFGAGAALRSVTDWAHYNHGYTSNILNTPATDSLAFARSSPINFADGLQDPLLMPHGMVDLNVQFQDIVRLGQRLIELGKENWEIALYPVEGHGFQTPSSWTDEYRRILKLFETHIRPEP